MMLNFMHIVKHNKKCIGMTEAAFKLLSSENQQFDIAVYSVQIRMCHKELKVKLQ